MNQILYGVAGTGKTFFTQILAINIIENTNFNEFSTENFEYIYQKYQYYTHKNQIFFLTFHPNFSYQEFVEGITAQTSPNGEVHYAIKDGIFKIITQKAISKPKENFVLIIDEINRGNVAKIFGELITLIEINKRLGKNEANSVILPYSQEKFCVPDNLYLIATMNIADRSIAPLDLALRRRFSFREILPNPVILANKIITNNTENIHLDKLLAKINQRIIYFLGENYQIGHSYFLENCDNLEQLTDIFLQKIIPLLREYFFEDDPKIALILQNKNPNLSFFKKEIFNPKNIFFEKNNQFNSDFDDFFQEKIIYKLCSKEEIMQNPAIFSGIYQ